MSWLILFSSIQPLASKLNIKVPILHAKEVIYYVHVLLLHVLLKTLTKCLVTWADTVCDSKPITAHSHEPI